MDIGSECGEIFTKYVVFRKILPIISSLCYNTGDGDREERLGKCQAPAFPRKPLGEPLSGSGAPQFPADFRRKRQTQGKLRRSKRSSRASSWGRLCCFSFCPIRQSSPSRLVYFGRGEFKRAYRKMCRIFCHIAKFREDCCSNATNYPLFMQ